ncbi:MAG: class I SAM-dependent methyltransferase [bacterium]
MIPFGEEYANLYDALYQDKNYEKECDFIEAIFKKHNYQPKTILELGCGTGGHALILAKRGYNLTAIDKSQPMLEVAANKAKKAKLDIEFIKGDITNISLNKKFDAVISMFAVMSYQITNKAIADVCKLARESLISNGLFLFDCWHGPAVLIDKPKPVTKEVKLNKNETILRFSQPEVDIINHIVKVNFRVWHLKEHKLNMLKEILETHPMRFIFPQEIKYFLEVAGFKKVEFYPFLEIKKELTEKDWNMMVVGREINRESCNRSGI